MRMERIYENERIRVIWDPDKCMHSGICTGGLPQVFDTHKRPWVDINAADVEDLKQVIDACPSGALKYEVPKKAAHTESSERGDGTKTD
jgi:omega-amidase